jgi:hypothetical protein
MVAQRVALALQVPLPAAGFDGAWTAGAADALAKLVQLHRHQLLAAG